MKKILKSILLISSLGLTGQQLVADTSLPYIGPEASACKVNSPSGQMESVDAGYLTSEDCSVLYVKPPTKGLIEYVEPHVYGGIGYCPLEVDARKELANYRAIATDMSSTDRLAAITLANMYEEQIQDLYRNVGVVSKIGANVNLNWSNMVKAYKDANPKFRDVRPLPISFGGISAQVVDNRVQDAEEDAKEDIILQMVIGGKKVEETNKGILKNFIPEDMHPLFVNTYAMGQSTSMQLSLNLKGACAMFDVDGFQRKNADVHLMPTYTYTYPVQTKSFFRVSINTNAFEKALQNVAKSTGFAQLNVEGLRKIIQGKSAVNVTLNDGFSKVANAEKLATQYKEEITSAVLEIFLNTASATINRAKREAEYTVLDRRTRRVCKKRLFWKSCSNRTYYVPIKKINWARVNAAISRLGGIESGGAEQYSNIHYMDTTVFGSESN